jgi:hypothetical protein
LDEKRRDESNLDDIDFHFFKDAVIAVYKSTDSQKAIKYRLDN